MVAPVRVRDRSLAACGARGTRSYLVRPILEQVQARHAKAEELIRTCRAKLDTAKPLLSTRAWDELHGGFELLRPVFDAVKLLSVALARVCLHQRESDKAAPLAGAARQAIEQVREYADRVEAERGQGFYPCYRYSDGLSMSDSLRAIADGYEQWIG